MGWVGPLQLSQIFFFIVLINTLYWNFQDQKTILNDSDSSNIKIIRIVISALVRSCSYNVLCIAI